MKLSFKQFLTILLMLLFLSFSGAGCYPAVNKEKFTEIAMGQTERSIQLYHQVYDEPATSLEEVMLAFSDTPTETPKMMDGWKSEIFMKYEEVNEKYFLIRLTSAGPDRKRGTTDDISQLIKISRKKSAKKQAASSN